MHTVIIRPPRQEAGARCREDLIHLGPEQQATFGRGGPGDDVDVLLPDPAVSRVAGRIRAVDDHWVISNLSRATTYVVENPEGGGEYVRVAPRRLDAPIPFEFATVVVPGSQRPMTFDVIAPEHAYAEDTAGPAGTPTVASFSLDESAKYFLVLVALCEARLRDPSSSLIPTAPEILERLRALPSCQDLSRTAVNFHIDYLATTKLRVKPTGDGGRGLLGRNRKADWQRAALVATAVRFSLVEEGHLRLLPARR